MDGLLIAKNYPAWEDEALALENRLFTSHDALMMDIAEARKAGITTVSRLASEDFFRTSNDIRAFLLRVLADISHPGRTA